MKKKVIIALNTSWNILNFRMGLARALQEEGFNVVAVAPLDSYSPRLKEAGLEFHDIEIDNRGTNPIRDLKLLYAYLRIYRKLRPSVLLHFTIKPNIYGSIAAGLLGIPCISNITGLGALFLSERLVYRMARYMYRLALLVPKIVFFQNSSDRDLFTEKHLVDVRKTELLPGSGIDTGHFHPVPLPKGRLRFLMIARLVRDKGIEEYVNAAALLKRKYPDVDFAILGSLYPGNPSAISEGEMNQWIEEGAIRYLGTSDDVPSVIAGASCIVLPSYREGLSRVLLEAAAMGRPIVTTDVPGCHEVVEDGRTGFLCHVQDFRDLAGKMEQMIRLSHRERTEMGERGRAKVIREFDERLVIQKYLEAIRPH